MFVNLVMKMEARNIAQRKVCHIFCVKIGDSVTTTRGKLQQAFREDATSRAQASRWHKMFSEGRTVVEDEQRSRRPSARRTGDNTARVRELVGSDGRLTEWLLMKWTWIGNRSFDTDWRIWDEKNLCQDGTLESHRATAGCAVEQIFWHPNALRWSRSLLTRLISHLATSFYFKK